MRWFYNKLPRKLQRLIALFVGKAEITKFNPTYHQDALATNHWGAFVDDSKFQSAYQKAVNKGLAVDPKIEWRAHVACWAAAIGSKHDGVFVECGVNRGFLSRIIIDYLGLENTPDFYLLDTYSGFSEDYLSKNEISRLKKWHTTYGDKGTWQEGMYRDCYEDVLKTFSDCPQVKVIKGVVPETLQQVNVDKVAYLSLDMNCAQPEIAALDFFWPKMIAGAYVVIDDYGWIGHEEQRDAYDKWAKEADVPLLSLPTGQALIVKQ